ncbi:sugar transporter [Marinifilum breve]|uniref:Sugar transporter n=1 Tax=Marinifilum breve TaxID=2184082 RepID=A0A2V4A2V9_9BACT|nr:SLBB domain-containing protein [Marinifilum breve]PXY03001.1 sugar transporter [Marinifilum breve]
MIRLFRKTLLLGLIVAFAAVGAEAQNTNINPAIVNVNALSDKQIERIISEMEKNGMSLEEAMSLARARGASQMQIDQMTQRIREYKMKNQSRKFSGGESEEMQDSESPADLSAGSEKKEFKATEKNKEIFGFHFFNSENLSFAPNVDVPVSDSYALGIGDEVNIAVYGASQQSYMLVVQKNGAIVIPDLGPVNVYGMSFAKASEKIKSRLISIYNGMQGNQPNTFADVSLGALKGVKVNVIGEVNLPGTYALPATASVFNALYLAGGPNENGSFRVIDLIRDGKVINSVDVYEYLIDGKTQNNVQLRDQDVIMVRPYVNRIKVAGEFKRTGLFEAKDGELVADILRYAGGFTDKAYTHRLDLYRNNSRTLSVVDVPADKYNQITLMNGDEIKSGAITERFENRISIEGAVYRPGDYQLLEGMKLSELIAKAEGLKEEAFMERAVITRKQKDLSLEAISFSPREVLNGKADVLLQREDRVQISSIFDLREARTVEIVGEVQFPGTYAWAENMKIADLIFQAGGFLENAEVSSVEVSRVLDYNETKDLTKSLLHTYQYGLDRNLKLDVEGEAFVLNAFDKVYIRRAPGYRPQGTASVQGEVKYAGEYGITRKDEKISDVIRRAGGLTPEAYVKGASLRRRIELSEAEYQAKLAIAMQDTIMNAEEVEKVQYQIVGIDLPKIMKEPGCAEDLHVLEGDQLMVPSKLETVMVSGSVLNPVAHTFTDKKKAKDYIMSSGGFAQRAKKGKVYVLYANGTTAATKGGLFGRRFPRIEPGCEIIVPEKPEVDKAANASKWLAFTSTLASLITAIAEATR